MIIKHTTTMRCIVPNLLSSLFSLSYVTHVSSFQTISRVNVGKFGVNNKINSFETNKRFFEIKPSSLAASSNDDYTSMTIADSPTLPPIAETSKRLFLVRHGEVIPPGGTHGVFYGALDVPLSPLGKLEAKAAATYLQQFDLEYVASSPLKRAVFGADETLKIQKNGQSKELKVYAGFSELDRGSWCGKTKLEIGEDLMKRFDACDESVTPEGGESYPFLKNRVVKARDELLAEMTPGRCSAIVSHLQVTRSILSDAVDIPIEEMTTLKIATASITCIDYDANGEKKPVVHFSSFKPEAGLEASQDGGNVV